LPAFFFESTSISSFPSKWMVLAIGAYLSGLLGLIRSIALGLMSALMIGVLKGSSLLSLVATGGLCIALVPLGVKVLLDEPRPSYRTILSWSVIMIGLVIILIFIGQAG
jgi:hypothetical protein